MFIDSVGKERYRLSCLSIAFHALVFIRVLCLPASKEVTLFAFAGNHGGTKYCAALLKTRKFSWRGKIYFVHETMIRLQLTRKY